MTTTTALKSRREAEESVLRTQFASHVASGVFTRAQQGDTTALHQFVTDNFAWMMEIERRASPAHTRKFDQSQRDAKTSEIYVAFVRAIRTYRSDLGEFHPYASSCIRNAVKDAVRFERRRFAVSGEPTLERTSVYEAIPAPEPTELDDWSEAILLAVEGMPRRQRDPLVLAALDVPCEVIAGILNEPIGTIKSRLHRTRKYLARGVAA